jgi:hypothetical protein
MVFDVASQPRENRDTGHDTSIIQDQSAESAVRTEDSNCSNEIVAFRFPGEKFGWHRHGYHIRVRNMQWRQQVRIRVSWYKSGKKTLVIGQSSHGASILCSSFVLQPLCGIARVSKVTIASAQFPST